MLDERYPIFFNDVELARSFAAKGYELWVTPDVTVTHAAHSSTGQGGGLRRQYVACVVRMLREVEPRHRVLAYQALVLAQGVAGRATRRPNAIPVRELVAALRGDPGPLPGAPSDPP